MSGVAQQALVYRLFGADAQLLYIGSTVDLASRIKAHSTEKFWWGAVRHISLHVAASPGEARAAEYAAIRDENPTYNVNHRRPRQMWTEDDYVHVLVVLGTEGYRTDYTRGRIAALTTELAALRSAA